MSPFSADILTETLSCNFSHVMEFLLKPRIHSQHTSDLPLVLISKSLHIYTLLPGCTSRFPRLLCRHRWLVLPMSYKQKYSLPPFSGQLNVGVNSSGPSFPATVVPIDAMNWGGWIITWKQPGLLSYHIGNSFPYLGSLYREVTNMLHFSNMRAYLLPQQSQVYTD